MNRLNYAIMQQFRDELLNTSMYSKFINIQKIIEEYKPKDGIIFSYTQPYTNAKIEIVIDQGYPYFHFQINNKDYYLGKNESKLRDLSINAENIEKILQEYKFTFAPLPDENFITEIKKIQVGDILHLASKLSVICITNNNKEIVFKQQYEGDLAHLKIDSFKNSKTFTIDKKCLNKDIHYLYGKAYDLRSNTADIRISINSSNAYFNLTTIEQTIMIGESVKKHIGPIALTAYRNDTEVLWYDSNNQRIDRNLVATMFGWAKQSMAAVEIRKDIANHNNLNFLNFSDISDKDYNTYLRDIKQDCFSQDFKKIIEKSFLFSKQTNHAFCINMTGLKETSDYNFDLVTYIFVNNTIYKATYDNHNFVNAVTSVSSNEFIDFCHAKYDATCKMISRNNEKEIDKYLSTHNSKLSKSELQQMVTQAVLEKAEKANTLENTLGIHKTSLNHLRDETLALLDNLLENETELTVQQLLDTTNDEYGLD